MQFVVDTSFFRKGTGHPTSHADGSGWLSSLTGTLLRTKVYETTFTFFSFHNIIPMSVAVLPLMVYINFVLNFIHVFH